MRRTPDTITLTAGQLRALKRLERDRLTLLYDYHFWGKHAAFWRNVAVSCHRSTACALLYHGLVRYVAPGLYALTDRGRDYAINH